MTTNDARPMTAREAAVALTCPYCGAGLVINLETVGPPYLTYERAESIECDAYSSIHCGATWEPDGTPRDAPDWVRYPDLYSKPAIIAALDQPDYLTKARTITDPAAAALGARIGGASDDAAAEVTP